MPYSGLLKMDEMNQNEYVKLCVFYQHFAFQPVQPPTLARDNISPNKDKWRSFYCRKRFMSKINYALTSDGCVLKSLNV